MGIIHFIVNVQYRRLSRYDKKQLLQTFLPVPISVMSFPEWKTRVKRPGNAYNQRTSSAAESFVLHKQ